MAASQSWIVPSWPDEASRPPSGLQSTDQIQSVCLWRACKSLPVRRVPDADAVVPARRGDPAPVRAPADGQDRARLAPELVQGLAAGAVPYGGPGGSQLGPVRAPGERSARLGLALHERRDTGSESAPEAHGLLGCAGGQLQPVRAPGHGPDVPDVAPPGGRVTRSVCIPDPHRLVGAHRRQAAPVRAPADGMDVVRVTRQATDFAAARHVPEVDQPVVAGRGQQPAPRLPRDRADEHLAIDQFPVQRPIRCVPDVDVPSVVTTSDL